MEFEELLTAVEAISPGAAIALRERKRQIDEKGFSAKHDSAWRSGQLLRAAECYFLTEDQRRRVTPQGADAPGKWPFVSETFKPTGDRLMDLAKGVAMSIAEMDRIVHERQQAGEM